MPPYHPGFAEYWLELSTASETATASQSSCLPYSCFRAHGSTGNTISCRMPLGLAQFEPNSICVCNQVALQLDFSGAMLDAFSWAWMP